MHQGRTQIIAIRHGETAWNVDTRIQGQLDIGLNDIGTDQARRVGRALADEPITAIYASDLQRAWQTAQAIADVSGSALHPEPLLRERNFGIFQGKTYSEVEDLWPEECKRWRERLPHWAPQGGESLEDLFQRVRNIASHLAQAHLGEQIVLVAHGGVLDMLYRLATGQSVQIGRAHV